MGGDFVSNQTAYQIIVRAFEDQPRQFSRHLFAGENPRLMRCSHLVTCLHRLSPAIGNDSSDYPADVACRACFSSEIQRELITVPRQKRTRNLEAALSTFAPQPLCTGPLENSLAVLPYVDELVSPVAVRAERIDAEIIDADFLRLIRKLPMATNA